MQFSIRGKNEVIIIDVISRSYPWSDGYWDINWLDCYAKISTPDYKIDIDVQLLTMDILKFRDGLKNIYSGSCDEARLYQMEDRVNIKAKIMNNEILWSVSLLKHMVEFNFYSSMVEVNNLINELELITKVYPEVGIRD